MSNNPQILGYQSLVHYQDNHQSQQEQSFMGKAEPAKEEKKVPLKPKSQCLSTTYCKQKAHMKCHCDMTVFQLAGSIFSFFLLVRGRKKNTSSVKSTVCYSATFPAAKSTARQFRNKRQTELQSWKRVNSGQVDHVLKIILLTMNN